ncbi:MAG: hypothetical protein HQL97_01040 [Magnetococcales bacterium]|nr:hypothetical protein [Magnetococcales bacterium]
MEIRVDGKVGSESVEFALNGPIVDRIAKFDDISFSSTIASVFYAGKRRRMFYKGRRTSLMQKSGIIIVNGKAVACEIM